MEAARITDILYVRINLTLLTGDNTAHTMRIDVGDELREFIDSLVIAGDYRTQSEVMRFSLPVEQHVVFFIPSAITITIIRILSQSRDIGRHLSWR